MSVPENADALAAMREQHMGQKESVPLEHYLEEFGKADPHVLSARSGIAFDDERNVFILHLLGRPLTVSWPGLECAYEDTGEAQRTSVRILMACLLLHGQITDARGGYLSYPEVPWGDHYFKAFQGRCIYRLAGMFSGEGGVERFRSSCERMGAHEAKAGDAAYDFDFVDGIMMRLILWEGDDEFPTTAQILFSDNAPLAFGAEELAVAGDILLGALKRV